jgi:DNA polymerase-1
VQREGEKEGINMPIQASAAEIVKLAMIDLHYKHHAPMLMQVHDELMFEIPSAEAKDFALWIKEYIPKITTINGVEFPVDVGIGQNWKEAKENHV